MSDNKDKLSFNVGGEIFDIPTEKKGAFLSKYPDAVEVESFVVDKDTFDIPVEKVDKFKLKYSDAKPLFGDVKKKEQTEPTQEAPLPGLGGVSEEPTPSPSVGQGFSGYKVDPSRYETKLSQEDEVKFQDWLKKQHNIGNITDGDYRHYKEKGYGYNYDFRAAFKENMSSAINEVDDKPHWGDIGKKPNHPTFSNESKYHNVDGYVGGSWEGENYTPPEKLQTTRGVLRDVDQTQPKYFQDLLTERDKRKRKSPQEEELLMAQRNAEADFYLAEKNNNVISSKIESISNTINSEISKKQDELQRAINEGKDVDEANKELEDFVGSMNDKFSELVDSDEEIQQERKNIESQINKELEGKMSDIHKRHYKEQDFFTGEFGAALRAMDSVTPLGIGDVIDDFGRAVLGTGRAQAEGAETGFDMLFSGAKASDEQINAMLNASKRMEEQGPSQEMFDYQNTYEEYKEKGEPVMGVIMGLVENPTVAPEVMLSSISGMVNEKSALAGGTILASGTATGATGGTFIAPGIGTGAGAVSGFMTSLPYAMAAAGTTMETGISYAEFLREEIESLNKEEGTNYKYDLEGVRAILNNEERLANVQRRTALRGGSIALIDFLTARMATGLGSKLLKRGASRVGTTIGTSAVEGVGGSLGEFTAMKLSGQDVDVSEVALEGIGEGPSGVVAAITEMSKSSTYKVNGESVSKEFIDDLIRTSDPMELAAADIKINNDEKRSSQLEEKKKDAEILESIDESIQGENRQRIFELEKERKKIESKKIKLQSNKKRLSEINSEIDSIVESQKDTVPAKQKGRLTKFSTPQDGIVGEVTYEDGTKKELTQEEYDALEKQEGLFDIETGTQPVAKTETKAEEAVAEEAAPTETPSEMAAEKEVVEPTGVVANKTEPVKIIESVEGDIAETDYQSMGNSDVLMFENRDTGKPNFFGGTYSRENGVNISQKRFEKKFGNVLRYTGDARGLIPDWDKAETGKVVSRIDDATDGQRFLRLAFKGTDMRAGSAAGINLKIPEGVNTGLWTRVTEQAFQKAIDKVIGDKAKATEGEREYSTADFFRREKEIMSEMNKAKAEILSEMKGKMQVVETKKTKQDAIQEPETLPKEDVQRKAAEEKRAKIIEAKRKAEDAVRAKEEEIKRLENERESTPTISEAKKPLITEGVYAIGTPREDGSLSGDMTYSADDGIVTERAKFQIVKRGDGLHEAFLVEKNKKRYADTNVNANTAIYDGYDPYRPYDYTVIENPIYSKDSGGNYKLVNKGVVSYGDVSNKEAKSDIKSDYGSKIEKAKQELTELKKQRDAIQEQAAGKVPVQPEAKAGEKVEGGKPQAEPEVAAEEGKAEVSEEEKVKAAKENLNSVWEKWKQSQKNLGVAFDPKSKANEDMELLEAFLTYIKALGIKTAKDIQKAFNDFTGGEATLDDAGAEFVAESVKEPVTKKTGKELSREVTFTNIYDIIEKVKKRTPKKANPKEVNKRAYKDAYDYLLKSDWFASATDTEQTEAIDDLKKLTGQRRESSPSAQKILGIDTTKEKISVDQKTVRSWMMQDLAKGYKLGQRDAKKVMAAMLTLKSGLQRELVAAMREIKSSGKLTKKQVDAIVNKFQKTNVFNPDAVETFLNYIQKVVDNADYVDAVKTANTTRKQIKRRMKNKDVDNNLVQAAKEFAKINPSKVDDINAYNQLAEKIKEGLGFSINSKQGVKFRSAFDISTVEEYSELELKRQKLASDAAFEEVFKEMFGSDFGMTVSEMRDFYAELDKETEKDEVKDKETRAKQAMSGAVKAFDTYSAIINEMLESGVDPFTGEDLDVDSKTKELIKEFMDIDISKLPLKDALRSVDALNNFVVNQTTGGLEAIVRKRRGEENVNKLVKDGVRSFKLKLPFGSGKTWATSVVESYLNSFASLPNLMDNLFGGVRKGLKVENAIGLSDVVNGRAAANKKANQILEQFLDVFSDKEANGESFNTASNMTERGMLGFMRRTVLSADEKLRKAEFERRKNLIKESIEKMMKFGDESDYEKAQIYLDTYNKLLEDSNSIEDVESKVDPVNKEAVEWWSKKFNEILPELTETSINVYNTLLENESNYNPDVYKRLNEQESELTELDDDSYNSNNGNQKVYDKENPMLMRVKKPSSLPKGRYVSLDFDVNNFNAYEAALVDVNTAAAIQQLKGALESDAFNQLVPDYRDRKILKDRITTYVAQIRGKGGVTDWKVINQISNIFARVGTATSLGGLLQPAKQTLPVFVNTLVNSGMSPEVFKSLVYVFDKDISNAINNSGMPIANRGVASQTTIDDIDKASNKLSEKKGEILYNGMKILQDKWMKKFLQEPDAFIARASFLVYYKQELKRKGINPSEIDWKNHEWNKEAANFAQRMVDRQQNVSDTDLQGLFLTDRAGAAPIIRKVLLPFQNFVLNQKNRMYADIKALQYGSKEDKSIAIKSLLGLSAEWASFTIISIAIQEGMYMAAEALISQFRGDDDDEEAKKKRAKEKERRRKMYLRSVGTSVFKDFISPAPFVDQPLITAANYALEQTGATIDKGGLQFGVDFDKSMYEEYEKEVLDISDEELKLEKSIEYLNYIIEAQKQVDGEMYDVHIQKMNEFNERLKNGMEYQSRIRKDVERYMKKIEVEFKPLELYGVGKSGAKVTDMLGSVGIAIDRMDKTSEMFKQAATLEYETESFGRKTVKKIPKELQPALYIAAVGQLASSVSLLPSEAASTSNKIQKLVQKEAKTESQLDRERKDEIKKMIIDKDEFYKGYESGMYSAINAYSLREYKKSATELTDEEIMDVMYKMGY